MIYDAVYDMSSNVAAGLIAVMIVFILVFIVFLLMERWNGASWKLATFIGLLAAFVTAILFIVKVVRMDAPFHNEMLADPEYQRILGDARALDVEAGKLLERAREVRRQIKEKEGPEK